MSWAKIKHAKDSMLMWLSFAVILACIVSIPFVIHDAIMKPEFRHTLWHDQKRYFMWAFASYLVSKIWKWAQQRWFPKKKKEKHDEKATVVRHAE